MKFKNYFNGHIILINNLKALNLLGIETSNQLFPPVYSQNASASVQNKLRKLNITKFIIFHPSAQYEYKVYDKKFTLSKKYELKFIY